MPARRNSGATAPSCPALQQIARPHPPCRQGRRDSSSSWSPWSCTVVQTRQESSVQHSHYKWQRICGCACQACSGPENYTHDVLGNAAHLACSQSDATHCSFVHLLLSNASRFWPTCLNGCFLPPISRQCDKNIRSASIEISGNGRIFGWQQNIWR